MVSNLPDYAVFVHRVNRLHEAFRQFIADLQACQVTEEDEDVYVMDSFPIMLAQQNHAYRAKVAQEVASRGYCSTKKLYYHGVKRLMWWLVNARGSYLRSRF